MSAQQGRPSRLPPMAEVAQRLREGQALDALAAQFDVTSARVKTLLNDGGWGRDGHPKTTPLKPRPLFVRDDRPWVDQALCAQIGGDAWYADRRVTGAPADNLLSVREAKKICGLCPVRTPCLEYALEHDERFGVWGGTTERERRRLKRGRAS